MDSIYSASQNDFAIFLSRMIYSRLKILELSVTYIENFLKKVNTIFNNIENQNLENTIAIEIICYVLLNYKFNNSKLERLYIEPNNQYKWLCNELEKYKLKEYHPNAKKFRKMAKEKDSTIANILIEIMIFKIINEYVDVNSLSTSGMYDKYFLFSFGNYSCYIYGGKYYLLDIFVGEDNLVIDKKKNFNEDVNDAINNKYLTQDLLSTINKQYVKQMLVKENIDTTISICDYYNLLKQTVELLSDKTMDNFLGETDKLLLDDKISLSRWFNKITLCRKICIIEKCPKFSCKYGILQNIKEFLYLDSMPNMHINYEEIFVHLDDVKYIEKIFKYIETLNVK